MSTFSLRLPHSLHEKLREVAQREGISTNQFVTTAVAEKLSALPTQEFLAERAREGDRRAWERVLRRVPKREPEPEDALDG